MRLLGGLAAFLVLVTAADAAWQPIREQQSKGIVAATLEYEKRVGEPYVEYRTMRLRVVRAGRLVFDRTVCHGIGCAPAGRRALALRDIGGSREAEILVEIYSGGAHCCSSTVVVSRGKSGYRKIRRSWGDVGYRGEWHRGVYYFLSSDPSFAYAFTSYADSAFPAQVWTLAESGRMRNATRERLDYVRANAADLWRTYTRYRRARERSVRGVFAAWCADQYLLGTGDRCEAELERARSRGWLEAKYDDGTTAESYVVKLRRFLRERGYVR